MQQPNIIGKIFGIVFGSIGAVFLAIGLVSLIIPGNDMELKIIGIVFTSLGVFFITGGLTSLLVTRGQKQRISRLMREGVCYDCEITDIRENLYRSMNYRHPFVVECVYKDDKGRTCLVKSGSVWLNPLTQKEGDIKARVWVNRANPRDYYVDVYSPRQNNGNLKIDNDYR